MATKTKMTKSQADAAMRRNFGNDVANLSLNERINRRGQRQTVQSGENKGRLRKNLSGDFRKAQTSGDRGKAKEHERYLRRKAAGYTNF